MGAPKVLLDNATLNHSIRVLEGRITGHIDDEFYDTSLNNLIHAIVLYKEIYVLETDIPTYWSKSSLAQKLDGIIKPIHLKEGDIFDLAETAFAKSSSFVTSLVGCNYVHNILTNAIRQMQRKKFITEEEISDDWERSKIFAHTEIDYIRKQRNNLRDLLLTYCRVLFEKTTVSEIDAVKLFKGTYDIPLELAVSLLYWLIYRTHYYHLAAISIIPRKKQQPACSLTLI
jgi:hypothetical protein